MSTKNGYTHTHISGSAENIYDSILRKTDYHPGL